MFENLNKYGLPKKYAIIGFVGGIIGAVISYALDLAGSQTTLLIMPFSTGVGGYIGGLIREKRGKDS